MRRCVVAWFVRRTVLLAFHPFAPIVRAFLDAGHAVTIFTRAKTNPHLFPEVERSFGDRDG